MRESWARGEQDQRKWRRERDYDILWYHAQCAQTSDRWTLLSLSVALLLNSKYILTSCSWVMCNIFNWILVSLSLSFSLSHHWRYPYDQGDSAAPAAFSNLPHSLALSLSVFLPSSLRRMGRRGGAKGREKKENKRESSSKRLTPGLELRGARNSQLFSRSLWIVALWIIIFLSGCTHLS